MDRILFGIFLFGIGMLIDAYLQVVNFYRTGYSDKYLRELVIEAIVTFTVGIFIVVGLLYFFFNVRRFLGTD